MSDVGRKKVYEYLVLLNSLHEGNKNDNGTNDENGIQKLTALLSSEQDLKTLVHVVPLINAFLATLPFL